MFFVFGPSGQMYRGGPDKLSQITPVRRVQRPQALRTGSADLSGADFSAVAASTPGMVAPSISLRAQDAVSAYVQTEQGPQESRQQLSRVQDVMTQGALTVGPQETVSEAWHKLAEQHIAQAPVVDAQGHVVGLLLRADMGPLELLPQPGAVQDAIALARRAVSEVMVSPVPTVAADTDLRRVATVLLETGLPGLPVTDDAGTLAGFISRTDILRAVATEPPLDLWSGGIPKFE